MDMGGGGGLLDGLRTKEVRRKVLFAISTAIGHCHLQLPFIVISVVIVSADMIDSWR